MLDFYKKLLLILCLSIFNTEQAQAFTLIIDPGHGGKDFGAVGKITNEKTINLDVALLAGEMIRKKFPDTEIIFTRDDDRYISLKERADIANKAKGDLFISIHVNSVAKKNKRRSTIKGASVYTLGLHKSAANFEVAKRENAVISLDKDFATNYEGFDPASAESYIMFELGQNKHLNQSVRLAGLIQKQLTTTASRVDNGVRQAGFWVLWATGMPSVLVELDFICNPTVEKFLDSKKGKASMAQAIYEGFAAYRSGTEQTPHKTGTVQPEQNTPVKNKKETTVGKSTAEPAPAKSSVTYHVQILASASPVKQGAPDFKGKEARYFRDGRWYKYYIGECTTMTEAKKLLKTTIPDFPGAFIIRLRDGKKID